jgi:hypothetical protein
MKTTVDEILIGQIVDSTCIRGKELIGVSVFEIISIET